MRIAYLAALLGLLTVSVDAHAASPAPSKLPNAEQARAAIAVWYDDPELAEQAKVMLGTCVPALRAEHAGQMACTWKMRYNAVIAESQADFHWNGTTWVAQHSESQELLPMPDPRLDPGPSLDPGPNRSDR